MKWRDSVQLHEPLPEDCTLIHNLVTCLKYSKLLSKAADTFLDCGILGESPLEKNYFLFGGIVRRGLRKIIISKKVQLEERNVWLKCRTNKTEGWQWSRNLKLTHAE